MVGWWWVWQGQQQGTQGQQGAAMGTEGMGSAAMLRQGQQGPQYRVRSFDTSTKKNRTWDLRHCFLTDAPIMRLQLPLLLRTCDVAVHFGGEEALGADGGQAQHAVKALGSRGAGRQGQGGEDLSSNRPARLNGGIRGVGRDWVRAGGVKEGAGSLMRRPVQLAAMLKGPAGAHTPRSPLLHNMVWWWYVPHGRYGGDRGCDVRAHGRWQGGVCSA